MPNIQSELERDFCLVKVRKSFVMDCHLRKNLIQLLATSLGPQYYRKSAHIPTCFYVSS